LPIPDAIATASGAAGGSASSTACPAAIRANVTRSACRTTVRGRIARRACSPVAASLSLAGIGLPVSCRIAAAGATKLIRSIPVTIRRSPAVLWIVLPGVAVSNPIPAIDRVSVPATHVGSVPTIKVSVAIVDEGVVVVDVDVVITAPTGVITPASTPHGAHCNANAE
jgi:hypothetical protein